MKSSREKIRLVQHICPGTAEKLTLPGSKPKKRVRFASPELEARLQAMGLYRQAF